MAATPEETYLRDFYRGVQEHPFLQPDSPLVVDFHSRLGTDDRIANDPIAFLMGAAPLEGWFLGTGLGRLG